MRDSLSRFHEFPLQVGPNCLGGAAYRTRSWQILTIVYLSLPPLGQVTLHSITAANADVRVREVVILALKVINHECIQPQSSERVELARESHGLRCTLT